LETHKPKIYSEFVNVVIHENELSLHQDKVNDKNEEMREFK